MDIAPPPDSDGTSGPQEPPPADVVVFPDQAMVSEFLDEWELRHVIDSEGDLAAPWEAFRIYFMFRGEGAEQVFSVRTFYDRHHSIEAKPQLIELADVWNRRTLWPKVYSHTMDDGTVAMVGEAQLLVGTGVGRRHFRASVLSWIRSSIEFDDWLGTQFAPDGDAPPPADS